MGKGIFHWENVEPFLEAFFSFSLVSLRKNSAKCFAFEILFPAILINLSLKWENLPRDYLRLDSVGENLRMFQAGAGRKANAIVTKNADGGWASFEVTRCQSNYLNSLTRELNLSTMSAKNKFLRYPKTRKEFSFRNVIQCATWKLLQQNTWRKLVTSSGYAEEKKINQALKFSELLKDDSPFVSLMR